jgi:Chaperone of endosialidase
MKGPPSQSSHVLHRPPQEPNEKRNPSIKTNLGRFDTLVARYYPAVYNFASRLTDDPREAGLLTYRAFNSTRKQLWLPRDEIALVRILLKAVVRASVRGVAIIHPGFAALTLIWFTVSGTAAAEPPSNLSLGSQALQSNTTGTNDTALGYQAMSSNTTGNANTAVGVGALYKNTTGSGNTATGMAALGTNTTGFSNTAIGAKALLNATGKRNVALGDSAGEFLGTGDNNIYIGYNVVGVKSDSNTIRIGNTDITATYITGISGQTVVGGGAVFVDSKGKLGTMTGSVRVLDEIKPMDKASEAVLTLKPVIFSYQQQIDPKRIRQFGLVAEEVEKVNPDLVGRDENGNVYSVRYDAVNAMLLNEFLKEHRKVEQLEKQVAALTAGLKKVSTRIELSKSAPQISRHPSSPSAFSFEAGNAHHSLKAPASLCIWMTSPASPKMRITASCDRL